MRASSGSSAAIPSSTGSSFGSFHFEAPVATWSCGTFFMFMYLWIARVRRRTERLEHEQHVVLLDQLPHHFHRLGRAVGVVVRNEVDLAALIAALVVDHL